MGNPGSFLIGLNLTSTFQQMLGKTVPNDQNMWLRMFYFVLILFNYLKISDLISRFFPPSRVAARYTFSRLVC